MDKIQAYYDFWGSFGWNVYDENSVPDDAQLPYITCETSTDFFGTELALTASLWDRSMSWSSVDNKQAEIAERISAGGTIKLYDGGAVWIKRGTPFAQRMTDGSDEHIRRLVLNVTVEFID